MWLWINGGLPFELGSADSHGGVPQLVAVGRLRDWYEAADDRVRADPRPRAAGVHPIGGRP
jgi:hypothetical protein